MTRMNLLWLCFSFIATLFVSNKKKKIYKEEMKTGKQARGFELNDCRCKEIEKTKLEGLGEVWFGLVLWRLMNSCKVVG